MGAELFNIYDLPSDRALITRRDLQSAGAQYRDIVELMDGGLMFKVTYGLYALAEVYADPDFDDAVACHLSGGVIALLSACARHDICDALPGKTEMLVPWSMKTRPPSGIPLKIFRTRDPAALEVGVDRRPFLDLQVRITTPARTVVDLYRIDPGATRQHALASLTRYLDRTGGDAAELFEIARALGVVEQMRPEIEVAIESMNRGMKP